MWSLPQPSVSAAEAFKACVTGIQEPERKRQFDAVADAVARADIRYREIGKVGAYKDELDPTEFALSGADMPWLYDNRMVKAPGGRRIYDRIKGATRWCPLCGERPVSTVDHYLPKSSQHALAVNPVNLVPACADCNKAKMDKIDGTLHPYFDHIHDRWLRARLIVESPDEPPDTDFFVDPPADWPALLAERVREHFRVFKLADLYQLQASVRMIGERKMFARRYEKDQAAGLREYLLDLAESWEERNVNAWQVALFEALYESEWFCSGGFDF